MNRKLRLLKILFFLSFYLLLSCRGKNHISVPAGIMPPDSMAAVLADMHVLHASAQLGYSENAKDTTLRLAYQRLWKKHHLSENSYDHNIQFYCDHPKLLDSVYEKVLTNLNQRKTEMMGPKTTRLK